MTNAKVFIRCLYTVIDPSLRLLAYRIRPSRESPVLLSKDLRRIPEVYAAGLGLVTGCRRIGPENAAAINGEDFAM
jgi:hypothetical protein